MPYLKVYCRVARSSWQAGNKINFVAEADPRVGREGVELAAAEGRLQAVVRGERAFWWRSVVVPWPLPLWWLAGEAVGTAAVVVHGDCWREEFAPLPATAQVEVEVGQWFDFDGRRVDLRNAGSGCRSAGAWAGRAWAEDGLRLVYVKARHTLGVARSAAPELSMM